MVGMGRVEWVECVGRVEWVEWVELDVLIFVELNVWNGLNVFC
jgi:hypothetical protein